MTSFNPHHIYQLQSGIQSLPAFLGLGLIPTTGHIKVQLDGGRTWLEPAEELKQFCARHLEKKIAISYCNFQPGNQSMKGVFNATARCVDLDCLDHANGVAELHHVLPLRFMFQQAAVIWSNGATLVFPPRGSWHDDALWCAEQGRRAEELGWFHYDVGCQLLKNGNPGNHEGHLFRCPVGWASKRKAPVMWWPPLSQLDCQEVA